jgi:two-component system, OmpR family, sensor histidine kinase CiaH
MSHAPAVRTQSIRVALGATLVVGVIYALIAAVVIGYATVDLTSQIDARLVSSLNGPQPGDGGGPRPGGGGGREPDRPFGPQVFTWLIAPDGTVAHQSSTPDLPAEYQDVTAPETATISGEQVRIAGSQLSGGKLVVAQSMSAVEDTQRTIIIGTLAIAPFLLLGVFAGAVVVGRRVAAPVEEARRRQLEFTADASHELRTPLSVIEAHTSLALSQERDSTWYRTAFTKVDRESRRMHRLLEDMLWLARFDAANEGSDSDPVDLTTVVRQTAERFSAVAEMRGLTLNVDAPSEPVTVAASAELLDRLVGVLVDNACKYAPDGGRVEVHVSAESGHSVLSVDDSGPGIADADRERIFDRFHRSVDTASQADGAGLGLAIADAVVKATRGKWSVGKSPLGGARFSVRWPTPG